MDYRDYYQSLGVPRSATAAEIKKAFRKLAREHHPDRNPADTTAEKRFKDVNEANTVLSDPEKRRQYDALGANWEQYARAGGPAGGPFQGYGGHGSSGPGARGDNVRYEFRTAGSGDAGFSDFFRAFFSGRADAAGQPSGTGSGAAGARRGGTATRGRDAASGTSGASFEDVLSQMGWDGSGQPVGKGQRRSRAATGGTGPREVEAPAELTLEESYHGTSRIVEVEGRRYEVAIPRGVDTGSRVRMSGTGPGGADVVVTIRMRPHDVFARRGPDLERELPLTLREALLGGEVPVATLKGRVLLTIPAGTQSGRTFRLAGQGMPKMKEESAGDLFVRTRIVLPTTLDDEAKAAATRFLDLVPQPDPRATTTDPRATT